MAGKRVTAEEVERMIHYRKHGWQIEEIAQIVGRPSPTVSAVLRDVKHPRPRQNELGRGDPTPQEIRAMCLEIQKSWTPAERRSRARYLYNRPEVLPTKVIPNGKPLE